MDAELLRRACERAGFTFFGVTVLYDNGQRCYPYHFDDPALPAYVASILAARAFTEYTVTEMDTSRVAWTHECKVLSHHLYKYTGQGESIEEAMVRAALEVLPDESAREG